MGEREKLVDHLVFMYFRCESQRQMHRLTYERFAHLEFWLSSFPLILLTAFSGVMAFVSSSSIADVPQKEFLSLAVGIISVVSVAWQQINKICNYATRAEMHKNASLGMKKVVEKITFEISDPDPKRKFKKKLGKNSNSATETENSNQKANTSKNTEEDKNSDEILEGSSEGENNNVKRPNMTSEEMEITVLEQYRDLYDQCLASCNSTIPMKINQAFQLADARLLVLAERNYIDNYSMDKYGFPSRSFHLHLFSNAYHEIYITISSSWLFPWFIIDPNTAVKRAMKNVRTTFEHSEGFDEENNSFDICPCWSKKGKGKMNKDERTSLLHSGDSTTTRNNDSGPPEDKTG